MTLKAHLHIGENVKDSRIVLALASCAALKFVAVQPKNPRQVKPMLLTLAFSSLQMTLRAHLH